MLEYIIIIILQKEHDKLSSSMHSAGPHEAH